ncbi:hypothetical protein [Streptomyces sp. NRRL S-920]|uniref:hypothetical protein n=1 Tax=Streptomyces sp. NRRL S-920 TaxID=1463921 RepID=UPI0004C9D579|nr:hypothetical protein [Streptomyces sp. NRRL S-920]
MDSPTLWVLAVFGFISLVCVMGTKLASDVEELFTAWIGVFQRLRERLRQRSRTNDEEGDGQPH